MGSDIEKDKGNFNLLWLDSNVNNSENSLYQKIIKKNPHIKLLTFIDTIACINQLKEINFEKTVIIISGSLSREFFIEFQKIINIIKVIPVIMIFTSKTKLELIKKDIISLDKFTLFNSNLVFDKFETIKNKLKFESIYEPNMREITQYEENDNCFSFEYINELKDLIFPLNFIEFMEIPNKNEIIEFNHFLLDKYSSQITMKNLIEQLLLNVKIPPQILVKYWLRAYTLESFFYREMNYYLERKIGNDFDVYIKVLYQGLTIKSIFPLINEKLYRGAKMKKKEMAYIVNSLNNKKEGLPGCICYNKAFLSSSINIKTALRFMKCRKINENEVRILYEFQKGDKLDEENATNADIQNYSFYPNEKEILFFPFSCFEITKVETKSIENITYFIVNLNYLGKYRKKIDKSEKIPETNFAKLILQTNILKKIEMQNESIFDFKIEKYISEDLKKNSIIAIYEISQNDINKKIQILNHGDKNKNEIEKLCTIYLNDKKIDFSFEHIFIKPGKYTFKFEFNDLLTDASKLFYDCKSLISLNFDKFKTNIVTDMSYMFNNCISLQSLDLSNLRTNSVTTMKSMFNACTNLKNLDLSFFNTENVTDMSEMFCNCNNLKFLNLSNFNTQNVESMYRMFYGCNLLFFLNLSKFQTNNVTNMKEMFFQCSTLNSLDLSNFDTSNVDNMENMFKDCLYFTNLKNEFITNITDKDIEDTIEKTTKTFFQKESGMISKTIQYCINNQNLINNKDKYKNLINQSIKDFINNINTINVILLGEAGVGKNTLINALANMNKEIKNENISKTNNKINVYEIQFLTVWGIKRIENNNIKEVLTNVKTLINNSKNQDLDTSIHCIWFCITGTKIESHVKDVLDDLINNYGNDIPIFIIYLKASNKEQYINMNEEINKIYPNKKLEFIPVLAKEDDNDDNIKQFGLDD